MRSKRTVLVVLLAWIVVLFAAGVVWLCSDGAAFMVGHAMVMDGGQTVQ